MRSTQAHSFLSLVSVSFFSYTNAAAVLEKRANPATITGGWTSLGCWTDVGRTISSAFNQDATMTNQECAAWCGSQGYHYAGTEYYNQCFCGNTLVATAAQALDGDCNTPCAGDATQMCGGPNRLNLYYTPNGPVANPGVNGYGYQGCFSDNTNGQRALPVQITSVAAGSMTVGSCVAACKNLGYQLAGVEYSGECYCNNAIVGTNAYVGVGFDAGCNMLCNGNTTEYCGGGNRLSVYQLGKASIITPGSGSTSSSTTSKPATTSTTSTTSKPATTSTTSTTSKPATTSTTSSVATTPTGPTQPATVGGWSFFGCWSDAVANRALQGLTVINYNTMTLEMCASSCAGFTYFGTEYSGECYCGNTLIQSTIQATTDCNMLCDGNNLEYCGAGNRLSVYKFGAVSGSSSSSSTPATTSTTSTTKPATSTTSTTTTKPATSSTSTTTSATATATGPSQPATVGTWTWYGCYSDAVGNRALTALQIIDYNAMTLEMCASSCAGYNFFGTEYSGECYCGNTLVGGSTSQDVSGCNMLCDGNTKQFCGGNNRLSVYKKAGVVVSSSTSTTGTTTGTTTTATTATTSATTSTTKATTSTTSTTTSATAQATGWQSYGCWVDGVNGRILGTQLPDDQTLTNEKCIAACAAQGYSIAGSEYSYQCFCGNNIINAGTQGNVADCNTPCNGNTAEMCGGPNRMSIFSTSTPTVQGVPVPQTGGLPAGWTYKGCLQDIESANGAHMFFWQVLFPNTMTATQCINRCEAYGYAAAGIEYGQECYCGDPQNAVVAGAIWEPETDCNVVCPGNSSSICGGGFRMTTYYYTGTAQKPNLYSWTFPQDTATAGYYAPLIGGLCVPLMAQQGINGKVSFLEKWGTGPANSSGAYELDLSLTNNFGLAWREMHVKTDVFCSAGVILPDKAGRVLSVGGWSAISTYGVRLYAPNGAAGQNGTNDWQENANELKLQVGRWYPSAMVMSNGSVMVIGGEDGSNGAAVPSIEVLPYTGTPPLRMQWLADTNPNNLYPFVCVLPGGGIFVAYWNQARIISQADFSTIKTLPNIPGTVSDDTGGRTYPLEGTAVLLPQRWPYSENLGVLICGGSTTGPEWAMDNCVSTQPEATNPTWTIERMPSPRVMTIIAPLPDGTYFIAGGAKHGNAGFAAADTPNLGSLLYDPTKPVGSRITVAANTTIARMYHSEAITLLDGRVLVSGSDPEDNINPQEYRIEAYYPPYLNQGKTRPTFTLGITDWAYNGQYTFTLGHAPVNGAITVTLLGAVSSTHGNSMGNRVIMPLVSCNGLTCTVTAPPDAYKCPPGWFQFFVLDGGIPAVGVYVRIGGDPGALGNWPNYADFTKPGM